MASTNQERVTTEAAPARQPRAGVGEPLVEVKDLQVQFKTQLGVVSALNGVSFTVPRGKVVGVVGESGSGKTITGLGIMQLIPPPGRVTNGEILLHEEVGKPPVDLLEHSRTGEFMRKIRGDQVSMIFQEPMTSLNPSYTVGNQIEEAILIHQTRDRKRAKELTIDILDRVGMPNPKQVYARYPHELSGGMRQRAMIAMALSCNPALLIADEPTTALDVTTEAQIIDLVRDLQAQSGMAVMWITHNMGVVAQICDEVAVMYLGRIVEQGAVEDIFDDPKHPYTAALLRAIPRLGIRSERLETIQGSVPDPYTRVSGCPFHPRCPHAMAGLCERLMPAVATFPGQLPHTVRCHLYEESRQGAREEISGLVEVAAGAENVSEAGVTGEPPASVGDSDGDAGR
ncbi:MAG: ABC transporter ATP-binding protein [Candidatus Dormibacteraeota bacterium]|nr:ABC transporter ATP-binding protein [Candidatus Dormibacteraeota bacterium]